MLRILLIYIFFCVFIPFQAEACAFAFFDSLSVSVKKALDEFDIRTVEDLTLFSERELRQILPKRSRQVGIVGIKAILSDRGESLARDPFVDDVGLSFTEANAFNRAGTHIIEGLRLLTERELRQILPEGSKKTGFEKIKNFLSNRGESLAQGVLIEDIGLRLKYVEALKKAGVHTIEDLRKVSWLELVMVVLPGTRAVRRYTADKIRDYLLDRWEFLAPPPHPILVGSKKEAIGKIKAYLSSGGQSLIQDLQ